MIKHEITDRIYDLYVKDGEIDKNRFWQMVNKIFAELNSSDCSAESGIMPIIEDAFTIIEIISEINEIVDKGTLPDGNSVNISTVLWAEDAIGRFRDFVDIYFSFKDKEMKK